MLGAGFGQFFHVSKRFNFPVEGQIARYEKHVGIAHSEYLQYLAELGIPSALLLFALIGSFPFLAWKRAVTVQPEQRYFNEAAILTAAGVGAHGLVDNCWTVPVLASTIVIFSLADFLPLQSKEVTTGWASWKVATAAAVSALICVYAIVIPAVGIHHNDAGVRLYQQSRLDEAEQHHLRAVAVVPDSAVFLENLSKVYIAKFDRIHDLRLIDLAQKYLKLAISASPHAVEPYLRMEEALVRSLTGDEKHDLDVHKQIVENDLRLLSVDPYLPFPRKNLAHAYYNLGQYERAMEEMQKAVEYEPNYVPAYLQMASWYGERGDYAAKDRYNATAMSIVGKYRDAKPEFPYENILLGRPESEWKQAN
jgi:tetratricopeptide (TPR) repeat protein